MILWSPFSNFPMEYKFFPDTWILPTDLADFKAQFANGARNRTFIIKPDNGCQGRVGSNMK